MNFKHCCLPRSKALAFVKRGPIPLVVANREYMKILSETRDFAFSWSQYVRCSFRNKQRIKLIHGFVQTGHNRVFNLALCRIDSLSQDTIAN